MILPPRGWHTGKRDFTCGRAIATTTTMRVFRLHLALFLLSCGVASAAALVPISEPMVDRQVAALEPNRGQAAPEILFLHRGDPNLAVTTRSMLFSPLGVRQNFVASNPDPAVRFVDPLPGVVNYYAGGDPSKWVTGIPRFAGAYLTEIYPGIDARYTVEADGELKLKLLVRPGADPRLVVFEIPESTQISQSPDREQLTVRFGFSVLDPVLRYGRPQAFQQAANGRVDRSAVYEVESDTRFGFRVEGYDSTLPLQVEIVLADSRFLLSGMRHATDAGGNVFFAGTIPDAAGKDDPFPENRFVGCGNRLGQPLACTDVAVYALSEKGEFIFASYFGGDTREEIGFFQLAPDGALMFAGSTDSADFPVTAQALQRAYASPEPTPFYSSNEIVGDFFAARLDPANGTLRVSTYLGGPNGDTMGEATLGPDGSLYFVHKWLGRRSAGMPTSRGALLPDCAGDRCLNGYAARLSPSLDRLLYGTYLPGVIQATAELHSDGSLYYAGSAEGGFPTTPAAFQRQPAGESDAIIARLDPSGGRLMFATYIGGPETDWILRMAVAPDGSVWAAVSSFVQCCVDIEHTLVRMDARGEQILAERPIDVGDLAVGPEGNLIATAGGNFMVGPDPFLANPCIGLAYLKLSPSGEQIFATYLPSNTGFDFDGTSDKGLPILRIGLMRFEIVEADSMGVFAGCVLNAASFGSNVSPGAIVTLFGSRMGPREGTAFQLQDGRVPTTLGGTRVLVNGEAVPILFASYWQVNAILPYLLPSWPLPEIQVEADGNAGNELRPGIDQASISLFRLDDSPSRPAAALNEDGSVNSARNPAKKGSRVALFGTGGGATVPPSEAGEVTPLELRPLEHAPKAFVFVRGGQQLIVEYAGGAPGLVAGVTQINIKLPDVISPIQGFPNGLLPLRVQTQESSFPSGPVTVAVSPD